MNKFTNWTKKPITWGAWLVMALIGIFASMIQIACMFGIPGRIWDSITDTARKIFKK